MKHTKQYPLLLLLGCLIGLFHSKFLWAGDTDYQCPKSAYAVSAKVCVAQQLNSDIVQPLLTTNKCEAGFEHTLGTNFCLAGDHSLTTVNGNYFIDGPVKGGCPEFFSRERDKKVCVDDFLALALVKEKLTLLAPKLDCAPGYQQKPRATVCSLIDDKPLANQPAFTPYCIAGFLRPPGAPRCLSYEIIKNTNAKVNFGVLAPTTPCPKNFTGEPGEFCQPSHTVLHCDSISACDNSGEFFRIVEGHGCCPEPTGGFIMPIDNNGQLNFTTIPVVHCSGGGEGVAVNCEQPEREITFRTP